jgi:hypothetical protein
MGCNAELLGMDSQGRLRQWLADLWTKHNKGPSSTMFYDDEIMVSLDGCDERHSARITTLVQSARVPAPEASPGERFLSCCEHWFCFSRTLARLVSTFAAQGCL